MSRRRHRRAPSRHGLMRATVLAAMVSCAAPAALLLAPQPAFAQSDRLARAQKHYEKGVEWYAASEYPKAIVEFLKGYNLAPNAMFLYNISLSYQKLENYEEALKAAIRASGEQGFPEGYPARNEARIAAFRRVLEARDAAANIKRAAEQPAVAEGDVTPEDPGVDTPAPVQPVESSSFGALGWTGAGAALLGAGALAGMAVVNSGLRADIEAFEAASDEGDRATRDALYDEIEPRQSTGKLLLYGGSGLLAVGTLLVAIDLFSGGEESAASALRIAPTDGGFAVGHGFRF